MTTQGQEAGPIANHYDHMGPNSMRSIQGCKLDGADDMSLFQNYEMRLSNLEEKTQRLYMTAQQEDDGMTMPRGPNLDLISSPACLETPLPSLQYLDGHPVTPQNYPLPMESFERAKHGFTALYHSYFPQMSSCFPRTKDGVSIQESSELEGNISNPQNCLSLSWPQVHAGLQLQARYPSPLRISQDGGRQGIASQTPQKLALARKRPRKEQQLNCPFCAKVFSRPSNLKKHGRTHERTFECRINGCTILKVLVCTKISGDTSTPPISEPPSLAILLLVGRHFRVLIIASDISRSSMSRTRDVEAVVYDYNSAGIFRQPPQTSLQTLFRTEMDSICALFPKIPNNKAQGSAMSGPVLVKSLAIVEGP